MEFEKLAIEGAWIGRSTVHQDHRGSFSEWFKSEEIERVIGRKFSVAQANVSQSNGGVIRGIHYSLAPAGQGKWVSCMSGSIWDVVVDIRSSSPTFKSWIGLNLRGDTGEALYISEGLGHGFVSLEENTVVTYLLTSPYSPDEEYEINPMDPDLAVKWPGVEHLLSEKDASAPTLDERLAQGKLPK